MPGTARAIAEGSTLPPTKEGEALDMTAARGVLDLLTALLVRLGETRRLCTGEIEPGTYELLVGVMLDLEKRAWKLAAMVEQPILVAEAERGAAAPPAAAPAQEPPPPPAPEPAAPAEAPAPSAVGWIG
jgi:hypothetical protein